MSVIHTLSGQNGWPSLLLIAGEEVQLTQTGQCFSVIVSFLHYPESNECRKHKIILQKSTMISIVVRKMLFRISWTLWIFCKISSCLFTGLILYPSITYCSEYLIAHNHIGEKLNLGVIIVNGFMNVMIPAYLVISEDPHPSKWWKVFILPCLCHNMKLFLNVFVTCSTWALCLCYLLFRNALYVLCSTHYHTLFVLFTEIFVCVKEMLVYFFIFQYFLCFYWHCTWSSFSSWYHTVWYSIGVVMAIPRRRLRPLRMVVLIILVLRQPMKDWKWKNFPNKERLILGKELKHLLHLVRSYVILV